MRKGLTIFILLLLIAPLTAECLLRIKDHYSLKSLRLIPTKAPPPNAAQENFALSKPIIEKLVLAKGVQRNWYFQRPPPSTERFNASPALLKRWQQIPKIEANYTYNLNAIVPLLCARNTNDYNTTVISDFLLPLKSLYVYHPLEPKLHPLFRYLDKVTYPGENREPGGYVTNSYGFLGSEFNLKKAPNTIRIAFVGSSTTADAGSYPQRFTDLIGYWLNKWTAAKKINIHFEIINAARPGIISSDISAIVHEEILPLQPDFILYYDGASQFWPLSFLKLPNDFKFSRPIIPLEKFTDHTVLKYSALVRAIQFFRIYMKNQGGWEPDNKPTLEINWPSDLNESQPNISNPRLPLNLPTLLADWDNIRNDAKSIKADFIPISFIWLCHPGMHLQLPEHYSTWQWLNHYFWPLKYEWIERMARFQNRVFFTYAQTHHLSYIDLARLYPQNPDFFVDAIHMTYEGSRLRAWIIFNQLLPIIQDQLQRKILPKKAKYPPVTNFKSQLLTHTTLMAECQHLLHQPSEVISIAHFFEPNVKRENAKIIAGINKPQGPYTYILSFNEKNISDADLQQHQYYLVAEGELIQGGISLGLQKFNQWINQSRVTARGRFRIILPVEKSGRYQPILAHELSNTTPNIFTIDNIKWIIIPHHEK